MAEQIIVVSGTALFVFSLLTWFGGGGQANHNAWSNPLSGVGALLSTFMLLQVSLARHPQVKLPALRLPWSQVQLLLGGLSFLLIAFQVVIGDGDRSRRPGAFLGLAAAAALAYGGFREYRDH